MIVSKYAVAQTQKLFEDTCANPTLLSIGSHRCLFNRRIVFLWKMRVSVVLNLSVSYTPVVESEKEI